MSVIKSIYFKFLIILITSIALCFSNLNADAANNYSIMVTGSGKSRDEAINFALREAVERAVGAFVYSTTSVENFQLLKDEIFTTTRGMVQSFDIVKEEKSENTFFITLQVIVKADEIKFKIDRSQKAVTFDNAMKDYALILNRREKLLKQTELLKAINDVPINRRYSIDYTGYEIVGVSLKQVNVELKARISLNPFFWDTYSKIIETIATDCSSKNVVRLCTHLNKEGREHRIGRTNAAAGIYVTGGNGYCVHSDIFPFILHRIPVDLFFSINKKKKGIFGDSVSWEKYTRRIGALDENILLKNDVDSQGRSHVFLNAEEFFIIKDGERIRSDLISLACNGEESEKRNYEAKVAFFSGSKRSLNNFRCPLERLNQLYYTNRKCNISGAPLDPNGIELTTDFVLYDEEDVKSLPSVKVGLRLAGLGTSYSGYPAYYDNCHEGSIPLRNQEEKVKPVFDHCVIIVK